jgi:hypothetical protein
MKYVALLWVEVGRPSQSNNRVNLQPVCADVAAGSCRMITPCNRPFWTPTQHLGGCQLHTNEEVEMTVKEWPQMQQSISSEMKCLRLSYKWVKYINALGDFAEKCYSSAINRLHLAFQKTHIQFS